MELEVPKLANMLRLLLGFVILVIAWADQSSVDVQAVVSRLLAQYGTDQGQGCATGVLLKDRMVFEGPAGTMDGHQLLAASRHLLNHPSGLRDYSATQEIAGRRGPI